MLQCLPTRHRHTSRLRKTTVHQRYGRQQFRKVFSASRRAATKACSPTQIKVPSIPSFPSRIPEQAGTHGQEPRHGRENGRGCRKGTLAAIQATSGGSIWPNVEHRASLQMKLPPVMGSTAMRKPLPARPCLISWTIFKALTVRKLLPALPRLVSWTNFKASTMMISCARSLTGDRAGLKKCTKHG